MKQYLSYEEQQLHSTSARIGGFLMLHILFGIGVMLIYEILSVFPYLFKMIFTTMRYGAFYQEYTVSPLAENIGFLLYTVVPSLLIVLIFKSSFHFRLKDFFVKSEVTAAYTFLSFCAVLAVNSVLSILISYFEQYAPFQMDADFSSYFEGGLGSTAIFLVTLIVLGPLFEELVFRGAVFKVLKRFGIGFAMVISSLLFALMHGTLSQIIVTFFIGMILSYLVYRSNSILPSVLVHSANNLFAAFTMFADDIGQIIILILEGAAVIAAIVFFVRGRKNLKIPQNSPKAYQVFFKTPTVLILLVIYLFQTVSNMLI